MKNEEENKVNKMSDKINYDNLYNKIVNVSCV